MLTLAQAIDLGLPVREDEHLDYVVLWRNHLQPKRPVLTKTVPLKAAQKWYWRYLDRKGRLESGVNTLDGFYDDISDHYPVVADFEFSTPRCNENMKNDNANIS